MLTCFLFVETLDAEGCLSLVLNNEAEVVSPLEQRQAIDIRALQVGAQTIVVLPTESSSIFEVVLPKLPDRKARAAIPYALEERLAQNVAALHFAYHYQGDRYTVVVTDTQRLTCLIEKLEAYALTFDLVTLDWFALQSNEACILEQGLLVRGTLFQGALSVELARLYLQAASEDIQITMFPDSCAALQNPKNTLVDIPSQVWLAKRLLTAQKMNLCQGELSCGRHQSSGKRWYQVSAILVSVWLLSILLFNFWVLHVQNNKIARLDAEIAVVYREFFPNASQIISPKFRIGQLVNAGLNSAREGSFWVLLDKFADAFTGRQITVQQIRFQNRALSVTLTSKTFAALEQLQQRLQQTGVRVTQAQASNQGQQVLATWELRL